MIIVIDASAGIEIGLSRIRADSFNRILSNSQKVISSDLYRAEVANVLWKYYKAGYLDREKCNNLLTLIQDLVDEYYPIDFNNNESLIESIRLNHSTYDMLYFTLARRTGANLMTLDTKLIELSNSEGLSVIQ